MVSFRKALDNTKYVGGYISVKWEIHNKFSCTLYIKEISIISKNDTLWRSLEWGAVPSIS